MPTVHPPPAAGDEAGDTGDDTGPATATPPRLVVAGAIVDDLAAPTRVLSARRVAPPQWAGWWELPGGKVDPGETPVTALRRELDEEVGVAVRLGAEIPGPERGPHGPVWPVMRGLGMRVWLVEPIGPPRARDEHDAVRWLAAGELDGVRWLPGNVGIVDRLRRLLRLRDPAAPTLSP